MFEERFGEDAQTQITDRSDTAALSMVATLVAIKRIAEGQ